MGKNPKGLSVYVLIIIAMALGVKPEELIN